MNEVYPNENREIPDPYFGKEEDYKKVYTLIDQACSNVVKNYSNAVIPSKINHEG